MAGAKQLTRTVRQAFLKHLKDTANVTEAAARIKVTRSRLYDLRGKDPEFKRQWEDAVSAAEAMNVDRLEAEAMRRAVDGVDKPYFYQGKECGRMVEYSDPLLKFLLQHRLPERYGDGGGRDGDAPGSGPVVFEMHLAPARSTDGEGEPDE